MYRKPVLSRENTDLESTSTRIETKALERSARLTAGEQDQQIGDRLFWRLFFGAVRRPPYAYRTRPAAVATTVTRIIVNPTTTVQP